MAVVKNRGERLEAGDERLGSSFCHLGARARGRVLGDAAVRCVSGCGSGRKTPLVSAGDLRTAVTAGFLLRDQGGRAGCVGAGEWRWPADVGDECGQVGRV